MLLKKNKNWLISQCNGILDDIRFEEKRTKYQVTTRKFFGRITRYMKEYNPNINVMIYGSYISILYLPTSDIDIFLTSWIKEANFDQQIYKCLSEDYGIEHVKAQNLLNNQKSRLSDFLEILFTQTL